MRQNQIFSDLVISGGYGEVSHSATGSMTPKRTSGIRGIRKPNILTNRNKKKSSQLEIGPQWQNRLIGRVVYCTCR